MSWARWNRTETFLRRKRDERAREHSFFGLLLIPLTARLYEHGFTANTAESTRLPICNYPGIQLPENAMRWKIWKHGSCWVMLNYPWDLKRLQHVTAMLIYLIFSVRWSMLFQPNRPEWDETGSLWRLGLLLCACVSSTYAYHINNETKTAHSLIFLTGKDATKPQSQLVATLKIQHPTAGTAPNNYQTTYFWYVKEWCLIHFPLHERHTARLAHFKLSKWCDLRINTFIQKATLRFVIVTEESRINSNGKTCTSPYTGTDTCMHTYLHTYLHRYIPT